MSWWFSACSSHLTIRLLIGTTVSPFLLTVHSARVLDHAVRLANRLKQARVVFYSRIKSLFIVQTELYRVSKNAAYR